MKKSLEVLNNEELRQLHKELLVSARVDTVYIVAQVMRGQFMEEVFPKFRFMKNNYYEYITKESNFTIKFNPIDELGRPNITRIMREQWNLKIELQYSALSNMPQEIEQLLRQFDFRFNNIQLACDFNVPYSQHYSYKGRAVVDYKFKKRDREVVDCEDSYYMYSDSARQRSRVYNKKKQLREVKETDIDSTYLLRYEITIKPMIKEQQPIHELDFDWIDKYLKKFIFVPNMKLIPNLKDSEHKLMKKIMRRRAKDFKGISDRQRKNIKKIARQNQFDFVVMFHENENQLFSWIPSRNEELPAEELEFNAIEILNDNELVELFA